MSSIDSSTQAERVYRIPNRTWVRCDDRRAWHAEEVWISEDGGLIDLEAYKKGDRFY